jgi:hypothetical protein
MEKKIALLGAGAKSDAIWSETMNDISQGFKDFSNGVAEVADAAVARVKRAFSTSTIENPDRIAINPLVEEEPEVRGPPSPTVAEKLSKELTVAGNKFTEFRHELYDTFFGEGETQASKAEISDKDTVEATSSADPADLDHPIIRKQSRNKIDIDKLKFGLLGVGHEIQRATNVVIEDAKKFAGVVVELVTPRSGEAEENANANADVPVVERLPEDVAEGEPRMEESI